MHLLFTLMKKNRIIIIIIIRQPARPPFKQLGGVGLGIGLGGVGLGLNPSQIKNKGITPYHAYYSSGLVIEDEKKASVAKCTQFSEFEMRLCLVL